MVLIIANIAMLVSIRKVYNKIALSKIAKGNFFSSKAARRGLETRT